MDEEDSASRREGLYRIRMISMMLIVRVNLYRRLNHKMMRAGMDIQEDMEIVVHKD